jgi:sulfur-carrier protein
MVHITFAASIQRHVPTPPVETGGGVLKTVFADVFADRSQLRAYILDDQGSLRYHLAVFVDGEQIRDPRGLSDDIPEDARIHVIQALSGG